MKHCSLGNGAAKSRTAPHAGSVHRQCSNGGERVALAMTIAPFRSYSFLTFPASTEDSYLFYSRSVSSAAPQVKQSV
jgi:hypothetical protein